MLHKPVMFGLIQSCNLGAYNALTAATFMPENIPWDR